MVLEMKMKFLVAAQFALHAMPMVALQVKALVVFAPESFHPSDKSFSESA